ncbi:formate hydrogenlyase maturation HycH family protein [Kosakonia sp. ML.JS2a]|uniref:formate hydrogenlyase maturation HycH family protein n=1 Tax=Kosakonia sp. ML.JS2a TaxID=2980557 RepID=UPI0021D84055|nr:formate hydrogenlyase maturation HycH family protein [Kosakonia sp. ML.JS2a]UXY12244.1 formate hydrogenlyase maturation HycH family protein [Kosakonia sp. ML.JS2a]
MSDNPAKVMFWALRQKFVDDSVELEEKSRQVMYYSLAIGHHVGVIDCLNVVLECPLTDYQQWLTLLEEGTARRKMQGLLTFGEIIIDASHIDTLAPAFAALSKTAVEPWRGWSLQILQHLQDMAHEPALYLMVRVLN